MIKKLHILLLSCIATLSLHTKEGVETYLHKRDHAFITTFIAADERNFPDAQLISDLDSESISMDFPGSQLPEERKTQLLEECKHLPADQQERIKALIINGIPPQKVIIDKQQLFTYCIDDKPVGFVRVFIVNTKTTMPMAAIVQIGIEKQCRHKGIGTKLLTHALAELKKLSVSTILVDAMRENSTAVSLFKKVGFVPVQENETYLHMQLQDLK